MTPRTALRRAGGLVAVLGAGIALAGVAAAAGPVEPTTPTVRPLPLTARAATVVCPGPETLAVPEGADPVDPGGRVVWRAVVSGADTAPVEAGYGPLEGAADATTLPAAAPSLGVVEETLGAAGAVLLEARTPAGSLAPRTSGVQWTVARAGDLRAMVVTTCAAAGDDVWLVGSGAGEGRRGRLLLANASPAPATVDVRVLTPDGSVAPPNGQGVVVPAASQVSLLLDALVPGAERTAVEVVAREGRVSATLHDSVLRGLVAGGADDVAAGAAPARRQVVPGLAVQASPTEDGPARLPAEPSDPGATAVRVAVPGTEDGVVRVRLVGPDGGAELPAGIVDVAAGSVVDVPVTGVPDGVYAAVVESDVPVVAGAVVGRAVARSELAGTPDGVAADVPPAELGWAAATSPLAATVVALPEGISGRLVLTAPDGAATVRVTPVTAAGALAEGDVAQVGAGRTVAVTMPSAAAAVLLEPQGGAVHAGLVLEVDDANGELVSVVPVDPPPVSVAGRRPVVEQPRLGLGE